MATSSVCTYHTETLTDQTRELSNDQISRPHFGITIEVGKAVNFVSFTFNKFLISFYLSSILILSANIPYLSRNLAKFGSNHEMLGKIFVKLAR